MSTDVIVLSSDSSDHDTETVCKIENEDAKSDTTEIYNPMEDPEFPDLDCAYDFNPVSPVIRENEDLESRSDLMFDKLPMDSCDENSETDWRSNELNADKLPTFKTIHSLSDSDSEDNDDEIKSKVSNEDQKKKQTMQTGMGRKRKANNGDEERERKKAERLQKQVERAQSKAIKKAENEALRSRKPEECIKFVRVCLDQQLLTSEYGGQILVALQAGEMQYNIQSNPVPYSIVWTREIREHTVGHDAKIITSSKVEEEEQVMVIWNWNKVLQLVHSRNLLSEVQILQTQLPGKTLTLVVYGAETKEYFRYQKLFKKRDVRAQVLGTEGKSKHSKKEAAFENSPHVGLCDWDMAFTELQLFGCYYMMMHNPEALGTYIRQFTKAIAEAPFKREKHEQDYEKMEWYGDGDSRDCVRVDKNGNGLLRLWQQQLCQFNLTSLEAAQAITASYSSPSALIQAYENCSSEKEAQLLLATIPVRRGVGPLSTVKSVGPELSKKIHAFFTSLDGKIELCDE